MWLSLCAIISKLQLVNVEEKTKIDEKHTYNDIADNHVYKYLQYTHISAYLSIIYKQLWR